MAIEAAEFRKVLGQFATGVTVVTTVHEGVAQGMTVSSFTAVSLEPPLVLFCADKRARTGVAVGAAGVFTVSVLRESQRRLSDLFAGAGTDAEREAELARGRRAATGCPILEGALGHVDCKVLQAHDAGDHQIYVGEVVDARVGEVGAPLLYYRGTYQALEPAWPWRDRYAAREKAIRFHEMVDFFERMQHDGAYAALLDRLVRLGAPASDARCLDLGCGPGKLARELAPRCREAVGVDASASMIARATARARAAGLGNVRFHEAQPTALPFPGESFDLVLSSNLLFHLPEPAAVLREAARVLRRGGHVALLEPTAAMGRAAMSAFLEARELEMAPFSAYGLLAWADAAEAGRRYDEAQLAADLEAAGFAPVTQERELGGMALLTLARRG